MAIPEPNSGCWLFTGAVSDRGYGIFGTGGKTKRAHRVAFEETYGLLSPDVCVLHRCDTPPCINPDHLWLGSHYDNAMDKIAKGRHPEMHGEKNSQARLTEEKARHIKSSSESTTSLAKKFGVSLSIVSEIRHGKKWKHL